MSTSPTTSTFDAGALRSAIEGRDAAALLDLYADDAVVEIADAANPPSAPLRVEGRDALRTLLEDVYGRDMTHAVGAIAVGADAIGYTIACTYPDGKKVRCVSIARLRDGRIVHETGAQAWDA